MQVATIRDIVNQIEQSYATAAQLEELRTLVAGKADSSALDEVTDGSSQVLQAMESKIKELEQLYSDQVAAVKAANETLSSKADAADLAALSTAMEEQQSSSVPSSSITQLQQAIDSAAVQIEGQKQTLESIQVGFRR